jgi:tetratricopeptide (TPR) repeat protein
MPPADDVRHYEARLAREPSAQAFAALAEAYRRAGRWDEAVARAREGLARDPGYPTVRLVLAKALLDRGDVPEARRELDQFLAREPDHEPALRLALECAVRLGDPRGALAHGRRLAVLDPETRTVQGSLRALEVAVEGPRAPGLREAGGLWPLLADDTFTTVTLGDLCVAQGLVDEATAVFSRILIRQPDHAIARARLADLARSRSPARRLRG